MKNLLVTLNRQQEGESLEKSKISVGEKPVVSMDVTEDKIEFSWKTSLLKKTLDHEISKCVGCGVCLVCPWDAITMGPVKETASGLIEGAPLVNVDPEACTFCGLCDSACVFGAFEAKYEGENAVNKYARIDGTHTVDEDKCAPCLLCMKGCPTGALDAEGHVDHKKDLVTSQVEEYGKGTIEVDEDKCSYCGLCELLCPEAIKIFWSDSAEPPSFRPAVGIRIDKNNCDYCGLCEGICPDEAISVNCTEAGTRTIKKPKITGKLTRDDDLCVKCNLCASVCPFDAIEVTKPFSGEVIIKQLDKCDPTGCNNCFNICPVKAIHPTGTAEKIEVLDNCIYCGACEQACPYDVLEVKREGYNAEELERARKWERARKRVFDATVGKEPPPSDLFERDIVVNIEKKTRPPREQDSSWDMADGERQAAMRAARKIKHLFQKEPKYHMQLERGHVERVVKAIQEAEEDPEEE